MKKNLFGKKSQTITTSGLFNVSLTSPDFPSLSMTFPDFRWLSQSQKIYYSTGLPSIFKRIFDSVCEYNRQSNYWLQFNLYHGEIFRCGTQTRIHCRTFRIRSKLINGPKCLFCYFRPNINFWAIGRNRKRGWNNNDQWFNSDTHHRSWFRRTF